LLQQNFWLQQQKFYLLVVPNFVAVTKPFFFRVANQLAFTIQVWLSHFLLFLLIFSKFY